MQAQEIVTQEIPTLEMLFQKNEKLRKALWGNHAALVSKLANTEEKLEYALDRLGRLERTIEGR